MKTAIVLLAAGKSARLGMPKQLLLLQGQTLIKWMAEMTLNTPCYPICVVLGANKAIISPELEKFPATIIDNHNYEQGMASSIKMGLIGVYMTQKDIDAVIFMTCDMPFVNENLINELIEKAASNDEIKVVASRYGDSFGIPVLFKRSLFEEILDLTGEEGAKKIIKKNIKTVAYVDFPDGIYDIDTLQDYETVKQIIQNRI